MNEVQKHWAERDPETFERGYLVGRSAVRSVARRNRHLSLPFVVTDGNQLSQIRMNVHLQTESLLAQNQVNEPALRAGAHLGIGESAVITRTS